MDKNKDKRYVSDNAQLMAEWNWERNTDVTPPQLTLGSHKEVWWKCSKGHEWQTTINDRNKGRGCPYCSGNTVLNGYNDLQTVNPTLAKEWNYEKNGHIRPEHLTANSGKKVWWKCDNGHEWQATIYNRNNGKGCPYCAGKKVLKGFNDLQTVNPALANEWNHEKNNGLTPVDVTPNSNKKVWWKCNKGHEWQARIADRNTGRGCPICTSERNTSFPEYAIMYYLINYDLDVIHSYREKGYELDIYIPSRKIAIEYDGCIWHKNRTKKDLEKNFKCKNDGIKLYRIREGLPPLNDSSVDYIVQKSQKDLEKALGVIFREIIGVNIDVDLERDTIAIENLREYTEKENSLLHSNSELSKEWNYEKNGNLKPEYLTANSGKKVWWRCSKGHEWQATISSRNTGHGCPYCAGKKVLKGFNDLLTVNPIVVKEWNYEKNGNLKPKNFTAKSNKKVWWKCSKGHEWLATIANRNDGYGCPYCSGRYAIKGENDLQTVNSALAEEWNHEKNDDLKPDGFKANSGQIVWWKCQKGHEWQARIADRNRGRGCPYCSGRYTVTGKNDLQTVNPTLAKEWHYEKNNGLTPIDVKPNSQKKVWWKCQKGHEWQATISNRNRGSGCPVCRRDKKR